MNPVPSFSVSPIPYFPPRKKEKEIKKQKSKQFKKKMVREYPCKKSIATEERIQDS